MEAIAERIIAIESDLDTRIARIDTTLWLCECERGFQLRSSYNPTADDFLSVERNLVRHITRTWNECVSESTQELVEKMNAMNTEVTEEMIAQIIMPHLDATMGEAFYTDRDLRKQVQKSLTRTWKLSKTQIGKEVGAKLPMTSMIDETARQWMQDDVRFWLRHRYENHVRERIQDTARKVGLEQGLGRREVGRAMAQAFKGVAGESAYYWEVVGSSAVNRGRSWSNLIGFRDAGIKKNIWSTVGDERVCPICGRLDGTEFDVASGIAVMMNAISETEDRVKVRDMTPWINFSPKLDAEGKKAYYWSEHDDAGEITKKHYFDEKKLSDGKFLTGIGASEPPAHGGCRCRKVMA